MLVEENILRLDITMNDVLGMQVAQGTYHLVEQRPSNRLRQCTKLKNFAQVIRSVFKDKGRSAFRAVCFLVKAVFDCLIEFNDIWMVKLSEDAGLFFKNSLENLLGVCIAFGGELDGKELSIMGGKFYSESMNEYLPKVPYPSVWMI